MAGNSKSGRKPVSKAKLALFGSGHAKKKSDVLDSALDGEPMRPQGLVSEAESLWDSVVPQLVSIGVAKRIDAAQLWSMCEMWGLYRAAVARANIVPFDKAVRAAVVAYRAAFDAVACRYGLTSSDRQKLEIAPPVQKDAFTEFMSKQQSG